MAFDENANYAEWKKQVKEKYMEFLGLDNIAKNACELKIEIEETMYPTGYVAINSFTSINLCLISDIRFLLPLLQIYIFTS